MQWKKEGRLMNDGVNAKVGPCLSPLCSGLLRMLSPLDDVLTPSAAQLVDNHGLIEKQPANRLFMKPARDCHIPIHTTE